MASSSEESRYSNSTEEGDGQHVELATRRREVYRIPRQEEEQNLLVHMLAEWTIWLLVFQVRRTMQAKDRVAEAVSQKLAMISQVASNLIERGAIVMRRLRFGCLAAIYACTMLTVLMSIAALLGLAFVTSWVEEPVIIRRALYFDYTQPHPTAIVSFIPSNNIQAGMSQQKKVSGRRIIPAGHRFSASVTLVMPESDCNRQIGMFQLTAEIFSTGDKILARSSQPCMLHFMSTQIRLAKTFLMSLPLLMGILGETQTVKVHVIDYQEENSPIGSIKIRLQPKAGTTGLPELYSAEIDIHSHLPQIKELAWNWKWTMCIWSSLIFYFLLVGLAICCCKQVIMHRLATTASSSQETSREGAEDLHSELTDNILSEPSRRHRSSQETLREGAEDLHSELTDNGFSEPSRRHSGSTGQRRVSFAQ